MIGRALDLVFGLVDRALKLDELATERDRLRAERDIARAKLDKALSEARQKEVADEADKLIDALDKPG